MGRAIMVQGTGSSVGKSALVAALCKNFAQDGYKVAPFKSQNMGSKTIITKDGYEISDVQYRQALAAGVEPKVEMNPILLKPVDDLRSEIIVNGRSVGIMSAQEYIGYKPHLIKEIARSLETLQETHDLVVIEGAGSPAEVNLRSHDLANMVVAELAEAPVILVADIDLGGVFAYVHGTLKLLLPQERERVQGIIVNKFRGDARHFAEGAQILAELAGVPVVGVIPFFAGNPEQDLEGWAKHVRTNLDFPFLLNNLGLEVRQ